MDARLKYLLYPPTMTFWQALQAGYIDAWRSEKYLAFVRSLPSALSGQSPCVAHHLVGHGLKGKGGKVNDMLAFPLTEPEHTRHAGAFHVLGSAQWERAHGDQRIYVMQTIIEAIHRGVLEIAK